MPTQRNRPKPEPEPIKDNRLDVHDIRLVMLPNGGWTVEDTSYCDNPMRASKPLGAFTNTSDMLGWLTANVAHDAEGRTRHQMIHSGVRAI